ncbi:hypothetical protein ACFVFF_34275 [Streptomyces sp. NPDC057680]|uniref:hypothetical protein n=1 Tax=Streptomyces sp. NPDC057680 TaxID=3346208 RepID=UPI0036BA5EFD
MTEVGYDGSPEEGPQRPSVPAQGSPATYEGNEQTVRNGPAVMGDVHGTVTNNNYFSVLDGEAEGTIAKPRFREGPYPPEEVDDRLRDFVEPPSYALCREILQGRRVLLLRGESGSGMSTAAFALLREVTGNGRIVGLDSATDLSGWTPSSTGGYVVQGIAPEAGECLDEVALNQLTSHLRAKDGYLVVIVPRTIVLPRAIAPWCRPHIEPPPRDVARTRLEGMAAAGTLSQEQLREAVRSLDAPPFKEYLAAGRSPVVGVDVAEELGEVAANRRTLEAAADNLRIGTAEEAGKLLNSVRRSVDDLALTVTIALLEEQDRSVVERFAARLRPLLALRGTQLPSEQASDDLLGRGIDDRLAGVEARLLPRTARAARGYRYWSEPVVFRGRHLAEQVLRRLWLDYEGFSGVLMTWLLDLPYEPGVDRVAGRRIGQVLCLASGPDALQQLEPFARSSRSWQRRLAAHAFGEVVQDTVLSAAVRAQLGQWSRLKGVEKRCTVAETCAGSLGLALPDFALGLLGTVLDGRGEPLDDDVSKAVSAALGVLLTEGANREGVVRRLTEWLVEQPSTGRRTYAVRAVQGLCSNGFPTINRAGVRRTTLADLFADSWEVLVPLVLVALDDDQLHQPMAQGLAALEAALGPGGGPQMEAFLSAVLRASGGSHGLRRLLFARLRDRSSVPAGEAVR